MEAAAARPVIRVAAICGSLRKASYNGGLLRAAAGVCEESIPGLRVDHVDISGLPLLNTDLETADGGFPPAVEAFRDKVRQADCFLFGSPEYNYSIATPLKNALDWASRGQNCWADKPAAIVSAGGGFGGGRSQYHLRQVGVFLDLHFINKPELAVKAFEQPPKFDSDGLLSYKKDPLSSRLRRWTKVDPDLIQPNSVPETRRGVDKRGRHVLQITSQLCRMMSGAKGVCNFASTYHDPCHYLHFTKITKWETTHTMENG
uniref:NAD(P)H dehydrogenase (quinone) n=1 Tax=Oryza rufipogon TaxID=4529 RepID=A0A0E0N7Q6_ORYRU